jgi:predicted secreted Zn-dependent protease
MAGKGKCTVDVKTPKVKTYTVAGTTLEEIWKDIEAKGPKDGGKARAAYTTAPAVLPANIAFDGKVDPKKKGAAEYEVTLWYKAAKITITPEIQMPSLKSDKDLTPEEKKIWKAYLKDVRAHEDEHVAATKKEAEAIAKEVAAIEGTAEDKDVKSATKAAQEDFQKKMDKAKLNSAEFEKRLDAVNKALDTGGHGPVLKFVKKK